MQANHASSRALAQSIPRRWRALVLGIGLPLSLLFIGGIGSDFGIYYQAAAAILKGESAYYPYSIGLSFVYHPITLVGFAPFAYLPQSLALLIWTLLNLGAFVLAIYLIQKKWHRWYWFLLFFAPVMENFIIGQVNSIILLGIVLAFYWSERDKPYRAGLALSIAIVIKIAPVLLLLYFLATGRWRVIVSSLLSLATMTAIALVVWGATPFMEYLDVLRLATGEPSPSTFNISLLSVFTRAFPEVFLQLGALPNILVIIAALSLAVYTWYLRKDHDDLSYAAFVSLTLFFGALTWLHHLILLVFPVIILVERYKRYSPVLVVLGIIQLERVVLFSAFILFLLTESNNILVRTAPGVFALLGQFGIFYLLWQTHTRHKTSASAALE